nr:hypothetical protein [Tanacetum cinerariifolium]
MACHLEEKFYPHMLTTISGQRWLLDHVLKLDGLAAGIYHGKEGRNLTDCAIYNPSMEADFNSSLQKLHELYYPLLSKLKSHKDASVKDIMNLLCLEGPLADAPGMGDLQPDIEQLKVPIHIFKDQVVLGETSLSFALSVSHSRVEQIRANIAAERDVWTPLSEPLSVQNLIGESSTSTGILAATVTRMTISTSFASAISIPSITVDDYEIVHADGGQSWWTQSCLVHLLFCSPPRFLKNGNDFLADLDKNLLRLASFPFSFCTSFKHFGDGKLRTASTLSGHTFNPSAFTLYPRNVPSLILKEAFKRVPTEGFYLPVYLWKRITIFGTSFIQVFEIHTHPSTAVMLFTITGLDSQLTLVISVGFHANMSRLRLSRPHSSFRTSSVKVEPIVKVYFEYYGWIATWIFSFVTWFVTGYGNPGSETIMHSNRIILLPRNVTVPPCEDHLKLI